MAPNRRRKPIPLKPGQDPASLPLKRPSRELFAQAVAQGVPVDDAYRRSGYAGNVASRRELRCAADVDARICWLLKDRIESDARAREKLASKEMDARLRVISELEAVAFCDLGDVIQWDRDPKFDNDGKLIGWDNRIEITPSRLLTKAQRAAIGAITQHTTKNGTTLKIDTRGKLEALTALSKILGMTAPDAVPVANNTQINVGQVNVGGAGQDNALESRKAIRLCA